ncbi:MAG: hypothetical protein D6798_19180 [Deltaproteobacteria bacterium]|nr:MAG: hypothetical protein D6798_19180 [Deltaproteobacteria bacterium]
MQGWEARSRTQPPPNPTPSTTGVRFGINTPLFFHSEDLGETAFGTYDQIADDLLALNASVARHPGRLQIFYDELLGGAEVPVEPTDVFAQIAAAGVLEERIAHLEQLVRRLACREGRRVAPLAAPAASEGGCAGGSFKLIITLLTLGTGAPPDLSIDVPSDRANPIALQWSTDHLGQSLIDATGTDQVFSTPSATRSWNLNTLDQANGYKRAYMALMTIPVAVAILRLQWTLLRDGILLWDYIEGFEIGNEVDTKNLVRVGSATWPDGRADHDGWAAQYVAITAVLLYFLPAARCFLPGLQSFSNSGPDFTHWGPKSEFIELLLDAAGDSLEARGSGLSLADIVAGIDIHFYHGGRSELVGLHYLYADVSDMRAVLGSKELHDAQVTVLETGVNVVCDGGGTDLGLDYDAGCEGSDAWPYDALASGADISAGPDARPNRSVCVYSAGRFVPSRLPPQPVGANDFQGISVWLRLSVAMAAGADIVGWHPWMARLPANFAGYGLRRDLHDVHEDISNAQARPSWYAFRRMAGFFSGATAVRRLLPDLDGKHDDLLGAEPLALVDKIWLIEVEGAPGLMGGHGYAYLAFIDPFGTVDLAKGDGDIDATPSCARLVLDSGGLVGFVRSVPTAPDAEVLATPVAGVLPDTLWVDGVGEALSPDSGTSQYPIILRRGAWPTLITSPLPLSPRLDLLELV